MFKADKVGTAKGTSPPALSVPRPGLGLTAGLGSKGEGAGGSIAKAAVPSLARQQCGEVLAGPDAFTGDGDLPHGCF